MNRYLLVTEKNGDADQGKDGGYSLVNSLKNHFKENLEIMHFDFLINSNSATDFTYPYHNNDKFNRRLNNAEFIKEKILEVIDQYTEVIFVHISMMFGFNDKPKGVKFWVFPMFLSPSYIKCDYQVSKEYFDREKRALSLVSKIITPSFYEAKQLINEYGVDRRIIKILPRGVSNKHFSAQQKQLATINSSITFCTLCSIKQQKDILSLIDAFYLISKSIINSKLIIIGPVQDEAYYTEVLKLITTYKLSNSISFTGYVPPHELTNVLSSAHIHLFTSNCETFGRSIFETLAFGLPNICSAIDNASMEYLKEYPFVKYFNNITEIPELVSNILNSYAELSKMAKQIGKWYDDELLGARLFAELDNSEAMVIADFDGTLYHKNDIIKTKNSVSSFNKYAVKVICSSRPYGYLKEQVQKLNIQVDYIISWSGAVICDNNGMIIHKEGIVNNAALESFIPIVFDGTTIQYSTEQKLAENLPIRYRVEVYDDVAYLSNWGTTKLSATQQLIKIKNWKGRVVSFGDSKHDYGFLKMNDGYLIKSNKDNDNIFKLIEELHYE